MFERVTIPLGKLNTDSWHGYTSDCIETDSQSQQ